MQVIDDDQVEAAGVLPEAAGLGAHFGERDAGRVVDEHARLDQLAQGVLQLDLIFAAEEAGLQLALVDPGLRGQHAAQQRLLAHFQAEDGDDGVVIDGRVLGDVDGERGLAHGGAGGDDDELALLQAAGHAVELGEVGGQAGDFAALLVEVVDGAEGVLDDLVERLKAPGRCPSR